MDTEDLITTVPQDEDCVQLGNADYNKKSAIEADVYIEQLEKRLGKPPEPSFFDVSSHGHDYGTYKTVTYKYHYDNLRHRRYMERLVNRLPEKWTPTSKKALKSMGYFD